MVHESWSSNMSGMRESELSGRTVLKGKGYAVRAGLKVATGDVVLFQDADLEYDINDYDALIDPILSYRCNFVIGSRHGSGRNSWKLRPSSPIRPVWLQSSTWAISFF